MELVTNPTRLPDLSSWTQEPFTGAWSRPLGYHEAGFVRDGQTGGIADMIEHLVIDVHDSPSSPASDLFRKQHVWQTYIRWKNRYPLLAARVKENLEMPLGLEFVISQERLNRVFEGELVFHEFASESEVVELATRMQRGPRVLSSSLLARLDIISVRSCHSIDNARTGGKARYHLLATFSHCIADTSSIAAINTFLEYLIDPTQASKQKLSLERRLAMLPAVDDLNVPPSWSKAKKRWKLAIAKIMMQRRGAQRVGGHTLPALPQTTKVTSPLSSTFFIALPASSSAAISRTCRENSMTMNSTLCVLSQLSLSRLLLRSLERGELSEEEWHSRRKEGMYFHRPVNSRPMFGLVGGKGRSEWARSGGPNELLAAVTYGWSSMPFMPAPSVGATASSKHKKDITWSSFLSKQRFIHRCNISRREISSYISHPLFLQFAYLTDQSSYARKTEIFDAWKASQTSENKDEGSQKAQGINSSSSSDFVCTNFASSAGELDTVLAPSYPRGAKEPKITVKDFTLYLRCRHRQLSLMAYSHAGVVRFGCHWDGSAFEDRIIEEWVQGIVDATEWYLGGAGEGIARAHL